MNTQVAKKSKEESNLPAQFAAANWGNTELSAADMLMPRVLLMQGSSDLVKNKRTKAVGDMIDSVSHVTLLSAKDALAGKTIEMVPLHAYKTWIINKLDPQTKKFKYFSQEPMLPGEDKLPWDFQVYNEQTRQQDVFKRIYRINVYALIKSQIGTEDCIPYLVSFQVFALNEGKKLTTHFMKAARNNKPPFCKTFLLGSAGATSKSGDTFEIFKADLGADFPMSEWNVPYKWYNEIRAGKVKADDEEESKPAGGSKSPEGAPTEDDIPF